MSSLLIDTNGDTSGPLVSVPSWEYELQLDQSGPFHFNVSRSDPQAQFLAINQEVQAYVLRDWHSRLDLGAGIIEQISDDVETDGTVNLSINGSDLLIELGNRSVGDLALADGTNPISSAQAITAIMALAPAGWTLDITTFAGVNPDRNIFLQLAGESILQAAEKVATTLGMHFRLHPTVARRLQWLFDVQEESNVIAIRSPSLSTSADDPDQCWVKRLSRQVDVRGTYTRIYPFGSGNSTARLTIQAAQRFSAPGTITPGDYVSGDYTFHVDAIPDNSYIAHTALDASHRKDHRESFRDIEESTNPVEAAGTLFDTGFEQLKRHIFPLQAYEVEVVGLSRMVYPGQTLRLIYQQFIELQPVFLVDETLHILSTKVRVNQNGQSRAVGFTLASVDRWPVNNRALIEQTVVKNLAADSHVQPVVISQAVGALDNNSVTTATIAPNAVTPDKASKLVYPLDSDVSAAAISNTLLETIAYSFSIPADLLSTNRQLHLQILGQVLQNSGVAATVQIRVKFGSTTIFNFTSASLASSSGSRPLHLEVDIGGVGATNTQRSSGWLMLGTTSGHAGVAGTPAVAIARHSSIAEDSTAPILLEVTVTMSVAHAAFVTTITEGRLHLVKG